MLPTYGSARFGSALTVDDFIKQVHVVTVDRGGVRPRWRPHVEALADAEGLDAHAAVGPPARAGSDDRDHRRRRATTSR